MSQDQQLITGHLDGLRGMRIVGWAFRADRACRISAIDDTGLLLASGVAGLERPDLLSLGRGKCDFAFSLPLSANDRSKFIHVLADDVEIANSPLPIGTGHYDGLFEVRRGVVEGWVTERKADAPPPLVTILDQAGMLVFQAQSSRDRSAAGESATLARFEGRLDLRCFGAGERCLSAYADGFKFAESSCNLGLEGNVETVLPDRCSGWLLSTDAPAQVFEIDIYRNDEFCVTAKCSIARPDVQARFPGIHKSGFACTLPPLPSNLMESTTLSFRFKNSDRDLFDGPFAIASRPAVIEAARAVSRMARSLPDQEHGRAVQIVMRSAINDFLAKSRQTETTVFRQSFPLTCTPSARLRLSVIIPIYRGVDITRACIDSVMSVRSVADHRIILVHDRSPESEMSGMLQGYSREPNLFILSNESNLGFIRSVNRALSFTDDEDVVLLNSDTLVFQGALDCLWRVAHSAPNIGTVTAMSNNATIFSYPHYSYRRDRLDDISWEELAAVALEANGDMSVDVPSGHGFCMLVRREVLSCLTKLDESFGRGYGEENDLCARAADLGFRNVAAAGVVVQHRESTSFLDEKNALLVRNLALLESRYPEYTPTVIEVERRDDLRVARWALDEQRLRLASAAGRRFALVVSHKLGGGTSKAILDIEKVVGYGAVEKLSLSCRSDGYMEVECSDPLLYAIFSPMEIQPLAKLLSAANTPLVIMHQLLGFTADFVAMFQDLARNSQSIFYAHDFYAFCPRVTMIDATHQFCNQAETDVCARCVKLSGAHPLSKLNVLTPAQHRSLFREFLLSFKHVVTPSTSAARYLEAAFPNLRVEALPHPEQVVRSFPSLRTGNEQVALFGALGKHKGSAKLLEIAQLARLTAPALRFTVIGYTDIDDELSRLGNVSITGAYSDANLASVVDGINGRLALFLSAWPETYSYTLSEAAMFGFFPLVPDIGAPAERVRQSGFGAVFPFPIVASQVIRLIGALQSGDLQAAEPGRSLSDSTATDISIQRTRAIFAVPGRLRRPRSSDRSDLNGKVYHRSPEGSTRTLEEKSR